MPSTGPGSQRLPSHCWENRASASQPSTPSRLSFPNERHRMTITSSQVPCADTSFAEPTKSTSSRDPTPGQRPVTLQSPEGSLLSLLLIAVHENPWLLPWAGLGAGHDQRSLNLESETFIQPWLCWVTWSKLLSCSELRFSSAQLAQGLNSIM